MTITFNDEAALCDYFMETGEAWLSVVAADNWPYLVTSTEGGDVFTQTFPSEREEGDAFRGVPVDSGTEWLSAHPHRWYPVTLVAPLPAEPTGEEDHA
jgi:hypothetical protein